MNNKNRSSLVTVIFIIFFALTGCEKPKDIPMDLDTSYEHENTDLDMSLDDAEIKVPELEQQSIVTAQDLQTFMEEYDSPLTDYADLMIEACEYHDCDPCLVVAIGFAESTLGKNMGGDYNFWGFMNNGQVHSFQSMENAIQGLAYEFGEQGAQRDKRSLEEILHKDPRYCTSDCEHWLDNVYAAYDAIPSCNRNTDLTFPK